ncbi:hypothetical protein KEM48_006762 [Puccinia striiformis f. sp. tritici PST-130]|nr:hypothetical protein KEM48_006762 [Puccinia striiformis f. sp. tritici PST-130]
MTIGLDHIPLRCNDASFADDKTTVPPPKLEGWSSPSKASYHCQHKFDQSKHISDSESLPYKFTQNYHHALAVDLQLHCIALLVQTMIKIEDFRCEDLTAQLDLSVPRCCKTEVAVGLTGQPATGGAIIGIKRGSIVYGTLAKPLNDPKQDCVLPLSL